MTAIILTGTVAVEQNIIGLTDSLAPVRVFPDPLGKGILDQLLLALRDGGFLLVEDSGFPAIGIVHIIENTDIFQVQGVLNDLVGVDAFGAVGADGLDIAAIRAFAFNAPTTPARPAATMMMSASRATDGISTVLVWQMVTVAFFLTSIIAAGLPTTRLLPITTAFLPVQSIP